MKHWAYSLTKLFSKLRRSQRGGTLVMVTVFVIALFAFAALSIDVTQVLKIQRQMHVATDAAALAASTLLTNRTHNATLFNSIRREAEAVALTNGVTAAQIAAGIGGGVQVGLWNSNTFTFVPNVQINSRWNAVRVPAGRTVNLAFGRVIGMDTMTPRVRSVARVTPAIEAGGIPFGVSTGLVANATNGVFRTDGSQACGTWGPVDVCGGLSGRWQWQNAIYGADCSITIDNIGMDTGVDRGVEGIRQGFEARWSDLRDEVFVLPVVDEFACGSSTTPVRIVDILCVRLFEAPRGGGNNLQLAFEIVPNCLLGTAGGGSGTNVVVRSLVE